MLISKASQRISVTNLFEASDYIDFDLRSLFAQENISADQVQTHVKYENAGLLVSANDVSIGHVGYTIRVYNNLAGQRVLTTTFVNPYF